MPSAKYDEIYKLLKKQIISGNISEGDYLPSENILAAQYDCSRNTIRRAISLLTTEGLVQSHHGKGVRVIHQETQKQSFTVTGIEGLETMGKRYGYKVKTNIVTFTELTIDERLAEKTGFPLGAEVYYLQRVRLLNDVPKMIDNNLIRKDLIPGITKKIASGSLFEYIEKTLGIEIVTIKRTVTVEKVTPFDGKYLSLDDYNCLAVITSRSFNKNGEMFEYTESRNRPDIFMFNSVVNLNNIVQ